jgi:hypothetical protein
MDPKVLFIGASLADRHSTRHVADTSNGMLVAPCRQMTALHFVRPRDLVALAFAALVLVASPRGGGAAHAAVWAGHQSHFAPPGSAARMPGAMMRARTASPQHAAMVAPRRMASGPVRAHNAPLPHFAAVVPVRFHPMPGRLLLSERSRVEDARSARLAHLGVPGPARMLHTGRPPVSAISERPAVRWPVGTLAHPAGPGILPPSQRVARAALISPMVPHRSGRR